MERFRSITGPNGVCGARRRNGLSIHGAGRRHQLLIGKGDAPMRAFDGLRVLELGQVYLGPYCGLLFAQMGAEVIKVEPPGGEPLRFRAHDPIESHEFVMLNSNKRSVVLDLKSEAGHQALLDLVGTADVLIENFAPGVMERLQLGPARLLEHNPRLVVASGKGYGTTGPYAHMSAMDITVQAMSGAAAATGAARRAADQGRRRVRRLLRRGPPVRGDHGGPVPARAHRTGADRRGLDARHRLSDAGLEPGRPAQQPRPRAARAHREPAHRHGGRAVQHLRHERRLAGDHLHVRAALARPGHRTWAGPS